MQEDKTAVYKARAADGQLLYVGIARNWGARWAQHAERSEFFAATAQLEVEWCETRQAALDREKQLIRELSPRHNVRLQRARPEPGRAARHAQPTLLIAGICEVCRREPAFSFSWFPDRGDWYGDCTGMWKLTGECTSDTEHYYIDFARWVSELDWLTHLRTTKNWFDEDDFTAAVLRAPDPRVRAALRRQRLGRYGEA